MKKLISSLMLIFTLSTTVQASTINNFYPEVPEDTITMVGLDRNATSETIAAVYDLFTNYILSEMELSHKEPELHQYLKNDLKREKFYFGTLKKTSEIGMESTFIALEGSEETFTYIRDTYFPVAEDSDVVLNTVDSAIGYKNGYIIITEDQETLDRIIKAETSMSDNTTFQTLADTMSTGNFFELYLNELNTAQIYSTPTAPFEALEGESIAMKETEDGFSLDIDLITNPEKMIEAGLDISSNDTVSLYKYMPKENPIFFSNDAVRGSNIYDDIFTHYFGFNEEYANKVKQVIGKETAFLVQNTNELIPAFTMMSKLKAEDKSDVKALLDKIMAELEKEINREEDFQLTKSTVKLGTSSVDQWKVKISSPTNENPYVEKAPNHLLNFTITVGITSDNILVVSSNKNIESEYKRDISNNQKVDGLIKSDSASVLYMDTAEMHDYTQQALTTISGLAPEGTVDATEMLQHIDQLFAPWGVITGEGEANNSRSSLTMNIEVDVAKAVETYTTDYFFDFGRAIENSNIEAGFDTFEQTKADFSDININQWHADDIYYLSANEIINGYPDGSFKPEKEVTRAEFTSMLIEALKAEGLIEKYSYSETNISDQFSDVDYGAWYNNALRRGVEHGLISGYNDGTVQPNKTISRGEAAQIITNIIEQFTDIQITTSVEPFIDVNGEWYKKAIVTVNELEIMTGKSTTIFAPTSKLNRAEAAVLIRRMLDGLKNEFAKNLQREANETAVHNQLVDHMDATMMTEEIFYDLYYSITDNASMTDIRAAYKNWEKAAADLDQFFMSAEFGPKQMTFKTIYLDNYQEKINEYLAEAQKFLDLSGNTFDFDKSEPAFEKIDKLGMDFIDYHNNLIDTINLQADY